jgi:hypothetical protein
MSELCHISIDWQIVKAAQKLRQPSGHCLTLFVQETNLLLMDSVAGVGYSYSLNDSDYTTSDSQAQVDMEATLRTWFQMYPYFANHTVFLQGD